MIHFSNILTGFLLVRYICIKISYKILFAPARVFYMPSIILKKYCSFSHETKKRIDTLMIFFISFLL